MHYKTTSLIGILGAGFWALSAHQAASPSVFTSAQAAAGRVAYERTCGKCHTNKLTGRKGDPDELPPEIFMDRWGGKTAGELIARFQETVDDPYFQFEDMNDETTVNITAYVLQVNGAKAGTQPLTRTTSAIVSAITR